MPFDEAQLVIGDGPEVYYIHDGKRRWVPDYITLQALHPQGWAAVARVSQADLLEAELGRPLPRPLRPAGRLPPWRRPPNRPPGGG
jgi:hypothetical protein